MRCGAALAFATSVASAQWVALDPVLNGTHKLRGWKVEAGSVVAWNEDFPWMQLALPDAAYNQTSENRTASWESEGTATLRVQWTGALPAPKEVWGKVTATAGWNLHEGTGTTTGTASNGLSHPYVPGTNQGSSAGSKWVRFQRTTSVTYEFALTQYAKGEVTGPMTAVAAGRSASVPEIGTVAFEVESLIFSSAISGLKDWNSTFSGTGGSTFPANGSLRSAEDRLVGYPFLHRKGVAVTAGLTHKVASPHPTFVLTGELGSPAFAWPAQTLGTNVWQTALHTTASALANTVGMDWYQTSSFNADLGSPFGVLDRAMPDVGPGSGLGRFVFRVFEPPISEVPTYRRVMYVVDSATGAETEYQAADKVSTALAALPDGPQDTCEPGQEWKLLDGEVQGLCDDQAVLMKRCLDVIGVPATAYKLHACTTWPGLHTLTTRAYTGPPLPNPLWTIPTEFLVFRHADTQELWEGVCRAADETWSVYPLGHMPSDELYYQWLRQTKGWQQYWWREPIRHSITLQEVRPAKWLEGPILGPGGY